MGLFGFLSKKSKDTKTTIKKDVSEVQQSTLEEDIKTSSEWVKKSLNISGYKVDYNLESMKEIDRFFDEQTKEGGLLSGKCGSIIFSLGSLVGETVIKQYGGKWVTDDNDPKGEINIEVHLDNGGIIWPVQRCMKRLKNGPEDGIYTYVLGLK